MIARPTSRLLSSSSASADPIRWGILSAGRIASDYAKAISVTDGAVAAAVAARSPSKAASFASAHSVPAVHPSYPSLLSDPDVDVVYVGTVADHHVEWARESLLRGKPTVVEKPLALSCDDARELVGLARERNVFLMEGMWTRCFPAIKKLRQLVASDAVGPIVYAQGDFGWAFPANEPGDRIWDPNSGGVTLDIGMYLAQLGRVAFPDAALKDVTATGTLRNGVDHTVMATVSYDRARDPGAPGDGMLQMTLTGAANTEERAVLQGTRGRIVLDGPAHVPRRVRVIRDVGREEGAADAADEEVHDFPLPEDPYGAWNYPGSIGFAYQIDEVGRALREGRVECESFPWKDSLEVARITDAVLEQVRGPTRREEEDESDWMEGQQAGSS